MRAEVINMVKTLCDVTEDIFIKTMDGIYAIREGGGNLEIRKEGKMVWDSSRQTLSIEDMELITTWYADKVCVARSDAETELYNKISEALVERKELRDSTH